MNKKRIVFNTAEDILEFVVRVKKYPYNMDIKSGTYTVDAKSLMALLNIGCEKEVILKVYEEQCEDLWKDLEKYIAA